MRRVLYSSARRFGVRGLPRRTRVHEVAPRDGLQNEAPLTMANLEAGNAERTMLTLTH